MSTDGIVAFLEARYAETEEAARETRTVMWDGISFHDLGAADVPHIVRQSPARVLADIKAKRQILAIHQPGPGVDWCVVCVEHDYEDTPWPCPTLLALVQPDADHPDFDPSWRLGETT